MSSIHTADNCTILNLPYFSRVSICDNFTSTFPRAHEIYPNHMFIYHLNFSLYDNVSFIKETVLYYLSNRRYPPINIPVNVSNTTCAVVTGFDRQTRRSTDKRHTSTSEPRGCFSCQISKQVGEGACLC